MPREPKQRFRVQISVAPKLDRSLPLERLRQLAAVKPKKHRDFHVMAKNLDDAREQVKRVVESEKMTVRSLSVGTDGALKCVAMKG